MTRSRACRLLPFIYSSSIQTPRFCWLAFSFLTTTIASAFVPRLLLPSVYPPRFKLPATLKNLTHTRYARILDLSHDSCSFKENVGPDWMRSRAAEPQTLLVISVLKQCKSFRSVCHINLYICGEPFPWMAARKCLFHLHCWHICA